MNNEVEIKRKIHSISRNTTNTTTIKQKLLNNNTKTITIKSMYYNSIIN